MHFSAWSPSHTIWVVVTMVGFISIKKFNRPSMESKPFNQVVGTTMSGYKKPMNE